MSLILTLTKTPQIASYRSRSTKEKKRLICLLYWVDHLTHLSREQQLSNQSTNHLVESSGVESLWGTYYYSLIMLKYLMEIITLHYPHLSRLLAWHGSPHIYGGSPGTKGRRGHVGCKRGSGEDNPCLGLGASTGWWRGSGRSGAGCIRACGRGRGAGCGAGRGRLRWGWLAGGSCGGGAGCYGSSILADLLHEIPHKIRREGT